MMRRLTTRLSLPAACVCCLVGCTASHPSRPSPELRPEASWSALYTTAQIEAPVGLAPAGEVLARNDGYLSARVLQAPMATNEWQPEARRSLFDARRLRLPRQTDTLLYVPAGRSHTSYRR